MSTQMPEEGLQQGHPHHGLKGQLVSVARLMSYLPGCCSGHWLSGDSLHIACVLQQVTH